MDREDWWALVHGVVKSRTRVKRLSISCMVNSNYLKIVKLLVDFVFIL